MQKKRKTKYLKIINRLLILFFLGWLFFLTNTEALSWNDKSRFSTIQNIVEKGKLEMNDAYYNPDTFDKVMVNGRFYSDKPPLFSIIASLPYLTVHQLKFYFYDHPRIITYLTNISVILLPYLIFSYLLYYYIRKKTEFAKESALAIAISMLVGTSLFAFSTVLNNHQPAALLIGSAVMYLFFNSSRSGGDKEYSPLGLFLTAFAFSLASFIDLGAVFIAIPFTIWLLFRLNKQHKKKKKMYLKIAVYIIGALIPLTAHYCVNSTITGDIFPASMHPELFQYPDSPFNDVNLLTGANLTVSSWSEYKDYIWHLSFGKRGFLLHDPLFMVGLIITAGFLIKKKYKKNRGFAFATLSACLAIFIYYSLFGKNAGGVSYSVRWFVIAIPLVFPFIITWLEKRKPYFVVLFVLFGLLLSSLNIIAAGNVISSAHRFKDRYSVVNNYDNFPNYVKHQYQEWKRTITRTF